MAYSGGNATPVVTGGNGCKKFKAPGSVAVILLVLLIVTFGVIHGQTNRAGNLPTAKSGLVRDGNSPVSKGETAVTNTAKNNGLRILKSEVTSIAKFYPYNADGVKMEVIAVKASDGTIRTAFNTCQVCYDSGRGYYTQSGDELVCNNCGNRFKIDKVEKVKYGCNPIPIFPENKTDDGKYITISKDFLAQNKVYFGNWKKY